MTDTRPAVLVLGGYGNFGKRIVELLLRQGIPVIVAGRDEKRAAELCQELGDANAEVATFDVRQGLEHYVSARRPAVVINTVGPFQDQDYSAATTCLTLGVPYVDLADGRDYVGGIVGLDAQAKAVGVPVISGASTVPALTSAVLDHYRGAFATIDDLDFGIAPGQRAERGLATTQAILGYVGKRLQPCDGYAHRFGWQDTHRVSYPVIGARWMSNCDVPDLDLLPPRYGISRIRFAAGMELPVLHFGIWALSWLVRGGIPVNLVAAAPVLLSLSNLLNVFGSADGGMHVILNGTDADGKAVTKAWFVVATGGDGPYIPAIAAVVVAKKILAGQLRDVGAVPCVGLMTLEEFLTETAHLRIRTYERP